MAQADWKRYYGIVMFHPKLDRTFVNGVLYKSRDSAHEAAQAFRIMGIGRFKVVGVVGIRGKRASFQRRLYERTFKPNGNAYKEPS